MAKILIKNMMVYAFHGIYEYEREQGQKLFLDVEMVTRDDRAADTDNPDEGIDAALAYGLIKGVVKNNRCKLLQTVAKHVGQELLTKYPHLCEVTTRIRKPTVAVAGPLDYVEVEVTVKA